MRSDDGPVPMNVGTHDARTTQSDQNASNHMTYDDVVRSREKDTKLAKEHARRDQTEQKRGTEEKDLMNGRVVEEQTEERKETIKAPRAANLVGTVTKTKDPTGTTAKGKTKVKTRAGLDIATIAESSGTSEWVVHTSGPTAQLRKTAKVHHGKVILRRRSQK